MPQNIFQHGGGGQKVVVTVSTTFKISGCLTPKSQQKAIPMSTSISIDGVRSFASLQIALEMFFKMLFHVTYYPKMAQKSATLPPGATILSVEESSRYGAHWQRPISSKI